MEASGLRLRESFRVAVSGRSRLLVGAASTTVDATVLDLSTTGMGLATAVATPKPPVGEVCAFELLIDGARIEGRGVVVWSRRARPDRGDAPNVGIRFERLEGIAQRDIDALVEKKVVTGRWPTPVASAPLPVGGGAVASALEEQLAFAVAAPLLQPLQATAETAPPIQATTPSVTIEPAPPPAAPIAPSPLREQAPEAAKRRGLPWIAIAVGVLVLAIVAWGFLGGDDEAAPEKGADTTTAALDEVAPIDATVSEVSLDSAGADVEPDAIEAVAVVPANDPATSNAATARNLDRTGADAESDVVAEAAAQPEADSAAPQDPGPARARRLAKVETSTDGASEIVSLRFDAPFREADLFAALIGPDPPRYLLRLRGIEQVWRPRDLEVGSPLVQRVRTGLHSTPRGRELHVVIDLQTRAIEHSWAIEGDALRVRLTPRAP